MHVDVSHGCISAQPLSLWRFGTMAHRRTPVLPPSLLSWLGSLDAAVVSASPFPGCSLFYLCVREFFLQNSHQHIGKERLLWRCFHSRHCVLLGAHPLPWARPPGCTACLDLLMYRHRPPPSGACCLQPAHNGHHLQVLPKVPPGSLYVRCISFGLGCLRSPFVVPPPDDFI